MDPPEAPASLETLPTELLIKILVNAFDADGNDENGSFRQLLRASPASRRVYESHGPHIRKTALLLHIHPDVLPEAAVCASICAEGYSSDLPDVSEAEMQRLREDRHLLDEEFPPEQVFAMREFHKCVEWFAEMILKTILNNDSIFVFPAQQAPSKGEVLRCQRMLYLAQIYFFLRRCNHWWHTRPERIQGVMETDGHEWLWDHSDGVSEIFYANLSGEEMAQLNCCIVAISNAIGQGTS